MMLLRQSDPAVVEKKPTSKNTPGSRQGINGYAGFMASDPGMAGDCYGLGSKSSDAELMQ